MEHSLMETLDSAAAAFHDWPCAETAETYNLIAINYAAKMIISVAELENILSLVEPYLPELPQ